MASVADKTRSPSLAPSDGSVATTAATPGAPSAARRRPSSRLRGVLLAVAGLGVLLVAGPGCTHPCLALAEQMCECLESEADVASCKSSQKTLYEQVTQAELDASSARCEASLDLCSCSDLTTEQGKVDCGLAR